MEGVRGGWMEQKKEVKATKKESESREEEKTIFYPIPEHFKG